MQDRRRPPESRKPFKGFGFLLDEKRLLILIVAIAAVGCVVGFALDGRATLVG